MGQEREDKTYHTCKSRNVEAKYSAPISPILLFSKFSAVNVCKKCKFVTRQRG